MLSSYSNRTIYIYMIHTINVTTLSYCTGEFTACPRYMTSSNKNIFGVTGGFPHKGQWRGAFMFSLLYQHLNKSLGKQSRRRWFETPSRSLWCHCNDKLVCFCSHDDVIKWKHFPRNWPFVRGIHRSRWIPRTKASDAELWCFLWSASV